MENRKRLIVTAAILLIAAALFILGMVFLPDVIVTQFKMDGTPSTTLPKLGALLIPSALSVVFSLLYYKNGTTKSLLVAIVGLAAFGLIFFFNR